MALDPIAEKKFARSLIEKLPAKIRVGAFSFHIEKWDAAQSANKQSYGECSTIEQRISVQLDMATRYKAVDTFLHEVSHAIFWERGVEDEDKEERIVCVTSSGWTCLFRDNQWLLDWIKSAKL